MVPELVRVRPGPAATAWLAGRIGAIQANDPLQPVTVVVPGHQAGLHLRRRLAAGGYANVRFMVLARLAQSARAPRPPRRAAPAPRRAGGPPPPPPRGGGPPPPPAPPPGAAGPGPRPGGGPPPPPPGGGRPP